MQKGCPWMRKYSATNFEQIRNLQTVSAGICRVSAGRVLVLLELHNRVARYLECDGGER